ncbi:MAG TPA: carboxypeptidase-like regulatory domain-containing protein, partial [Gemmatimonadales bacterium]|nr:carboxypeptidase-like regulatory domain-containing protein [Gemmatimonadales bacterium]
MPLPGAVVVLTDLDRDTITAGDGRYLLSDVPPGPQHLLIRFMGYTPRTFQVFVPAEGELEVNISLDPEPVRLPVIEVQVPVATS